MNIDELALKLAGIHTERTMFAVTDQEICNFARALIAEYEAAGSEPFCYLIDDEGYEQSHKEYPGAFPVYLRPDPRVAELERQLASYKADAERYRWLNGYVMDNGAFPTYPMIPSQVDMHQLDAEIDRHIANAVYSLADERNRMLKLGRFSDAALTATKGES